MKIIKFAGKMLLVILGGILFPILIWVALGIALYRKKQPKPKMVPALSQVLKG